MVFSSLIFLYWFLPVTIAIYYVSPRAVRNVILLLASLVFYAWGEPIYIGIMIFSTLFDYTNGLLIDKYRSRKKLARFIFISSIAVNLGILGFFKYYGFLIENINSLLGLHIPITSLPLPVGISFYTFQTMSYVVDVYLNKYPVQRNLIAFGTYVTMFPQLVAGPIVQYGDIAKQLKDRPMTLDKFGSGAELFIRGLAKKVLLANNIGLLWTSVHQTPMAELTVLSAWLGIVAFTFQIYFDFSGYSDMARGLGKMFGFDFKENFNYPYVSRSVTEFWRRWHISLGSWFREYVYIPLGGNRGGIKLQLRNLMIVWFLTGFWHGASWNFIVWGLYFGLFVTMEKLFLLRWLQQLPRILAHVYTLMIVMIGWVIFEMGSLSSAFSYIQTMFGMGNHSLSNEASWYGLSTNLFLLIILALCATPYPRKLMMWLQSKFRVVDFAIPVMYLGFLMVSTAYLVNETYNPFLYFRF
ncbi:MBOAT family protein [Paenibacillus sp. N1-5-1-14]|uniref:MBOAT family O-acyltransferase n=1 Tax=Paenibacillus radicibacter TaxID=2972488 RepID=UPI0021590B62|nr:MBOAT family protein [Paenibacillus radicibacter]MCR8644244.1 MBOAT family protein [Paenibacillus radicibacter]